MNVGHILLRWPWLFDLDVTIYERINHCSFAYNGKKVKLLLNQAKPPNSEKKIDKGKRKVVALTPEKNVDKGKQKMVMNLISHDQVENSLNEGSTCCTLVAWEAEPETESQIPEHIKPILEFSEVLPKDLSGKLPPMRDIQHAINLASGATLQTCLITGLTLSSTQNYNGR